MSTSIHSLPANFEGILDYIGHLVARGGPTEADYAVIDELMQRLDEMSPPELGALRAAFGDALSASTMQGFAFLKPHGYAGDFEIIDRIYCGYESPVPRIAAWDRYFHLQPASSAVRNRKAYFHVLLDAQVARGGARRVLNLASGPGRCMAEWLDARPAAPVRFDCVELDPKAIAHAQRLNREHPGRVAFYRENVFWHTPGSAYDLIWAAGICDYFSDALFAKIIRRYRAALAPGGELVLGNFSEKNPSRNYMEILGEWRLRHRSPEDLLRIARQAGCPEAALRVDAEPEGVNLFLHIAAPVAAGEGRNA